MKTSSRAAVLAAILSGYGCSLHEAPDPELAARESGFTTAPRLEQTTASIVRNAVGEPIVSGRRRYVGVSVAVIRDGVRTLHHFGESVLGAGVAPNRDTLYAIGSVTKTVTATLLARMEREGTVEFGDELGDLLTPDWQLPAERQGITLVQLATYHSGLPKNPPGGEAGYRYGSYPDDMKALMDSLEQCGSNTCRDPLNVWDKSRYSNYGYAVLSEVLAREGGNSTVQGALSSKVLNPLGMFRTNNKANLTDVSCVVGGCSYDDYGDCTYAQACNSTFSRNAAIGYHVTDAGTWARENSPGSDDNVKAGSGVLWSTPGDMLTWLAYNLGIGTIVQQVLTDALPSIHVVRTFDDMGLAWQQREESYGDVWKKSGALPAEKGARTASFTAYIAFIEGSDDGVVVMANSDLGVGSIAFDILEAIAD